MKWKLVILVLLILLGVISCSQRQEADVELEEVTVIQNNTLYIDSVGFRYYQKFSRPCLLSSRTFAFSDSMSEVLDSMNMDTLIKMNLTRP